MLTHAEPAEATGSSSAGRATAGNAIDEARADIEQDLSFATLCSALELGVPARVSAAISLIADGTVEPDEFFDNHPVTGEQICVIDNLLEMYASPHRPDLSQFQERLAPTKVERLTSDIDCLRQLLAACKRSPHPEIQNVASNYEVASACMFIHRAASMPKEHHANAINSVAPMLEELLQKLEQGNAVPKIGDLAQALDDGLTAATHPDARQTYHSYGLRVLAHQPASPEKAEQAVGFVQSAGMLPQEHQQDAIKTALQLIAEIPRDALEPRAQVDSLAHPLTECAYGLTGVHDDVFGKSAIDLLRASSGKDENIYLRPGICRIVAQIALLPRHDTGEVRFARLPAEDKVDLFLEMLDASLLRDMHQMGGAEDWGPQMLPHLPQSVQQQADDQLRLAEDGRSPMLGFRLAAMNWQW